MEMIVKSGGQTNVTVCELGGCGAGYCYCFGVNASCTCFVAGGNCSCFQCVINLG